MSHFSGSTTVRIAVALATALAGAAIAGLGPLPGAVRIGQSAPMVRPGACLPAASVCADPSGLLRAGATA